LGLLVILALLRLDLARAAPELDPELDPEAVAAFEALTDGDLTRELRDVWPLVCRSVGIVDAVQPAARFVTREDLAALVRDALMASPEWDDKVHPAKAAIEAAAKRAEVTAGAYIKGSWELLLVRDLMLESATQLGDPRMLGLDHVRVMLTHEAVHAAAERRAEALGAAALDRGERAEPGLAHASEGYAQFITRAVSRERGEDEAFEFLARQLDLDTLPAPAFVRHVIAPKLASLLSSYSDGLRFVDAVAAVEGDGLFERLSRDPVLDADLLRHPERYLGPESAPRPRFVLDAGLPLLAPALGGEWSFHVAESDESQLDALLHLLPPAERRRVLEPLVQREHAFVRRQLSPEELRAVFEAREHLDPYFTGVRFGIVDLLEFTDAPSARAFVGSFERARALAQSLRHEGRRTLKRESRVLTSDGVLGVASTQVGLLQRTVARSVQLVRGEVVARLSFEGSPLPEMQTVQRLARMLLDETHAAPDDVREPRPTTDR